MRSRVSWNGPAIAIFALFAGLGWPDLAASSPTATSAQTSLSKSIPEMKIWREFVPLLKSGKFTKDRIKPLVEGPGQAEVLMGFLGQARSQAHWEEWDREPEIVRSGRVISFILPLTFGSEPPLSYCFMFVEDGGHGISTISKRSLSVWTRRRRRRHRTFRIPRKHRRPGIARRTIGR